MKKYTFFLLCLICTLGLCACRAEKQPDATVGTTQPPVTTQPITTAPESTMETNIPDPSVDDDHLVQTTVSEGAEETSPSVRKRIG